MSVLVTVPDGRNGPDPLPLPLHALGPYHRWKGALKAVDEEVVIHLRTSSSHDGRTVSGLVIAVAESVMFRQPEQMVLRVSADRKTVVVPLGAIDHFTYEEGE